MPVAIRLSRNFYDRFGDEAAGELVNALNTVDLAYRTELKDVYAQNFALFDAKLEQRFAECYARIDVRFAEQDAKWERRVVEMDTKWERRFARLETSLAERETRIMRWVLGFCAANTLTLIGLILAVLRAR
jgi:hypothetical protein